VQEETKREDGQAVAYAAKKGQPSKGFAQKRGNFEHKQKGSGSGSSNGVRCYWCGNAGHMVGECPVLRDIVCNMCGKSGHMRVTCYQEHGPPERPPWKGKGNFGGSSGNTGQSGGVAYTAYAEDPWASMWILNSGSTQHLTGDRSKFREMETLTTEKQILFRNKQYLTAEGVEKVELRCATPEGERVVTLEEVFYVPGAAANLLSVKRAVDWGAEVVMSRGMCYIKDKGEVCWNELETFQLNCERCK
jgi:hypothetical protein